MTGPLVLIAGAGPTGLVLALWLTRLGIAVRIIDKSAEPGSTSRALAVQARTLEHYRQAGIADTVIAAGVKIANLNFWAQGARVARVPIRGIGEGLTPYPFPLVLPQDVHERLLIEELKALGVNVERRTKLLRFEQQGGAVRVALELPDGSEENCEAAYLAGCDGASSTVREQLGIGFPGGTYEGLFYVADVEASGPAVNQELHVDLEDADFALVFPMQGEGRIRLVGIVREGSARERGELTVEDVRGKAIAHLKLHIAKVSWFSTYRVHHRVARSFRQGRAFLLGDAAHVHSPVGGQGMNTGIGDAVNLAWKLAAVLKNEASEALLDTYEPERIAFAQRLVATTDRVFTAVTRQGPLARLVRTRVVPSLAPLLFRLAAVRRFFFRTVSQTAIRYRQSSLSAGRAGAVHGGDRLPWFEMVQGPDNFAPLASLKWQVHVYGEPRPGVAEACGNLGLALHRFPWQRAMAQAGLMRGALYLIRPDGYVALADARREPDSLRRYFEERRNLVRRG